MRQKLEVQRVPPGRRSALRTKVIVAIVTGSLGIVAAVISAYIISRPKPDPTPPPRLLVLSGRVTASATRIPIPNAFVTLDITGVPTSNYTDDHGVFSIPVDKEHEGESAKLAARAKGYQEKDTYIAVSSKHPFLDIRLESAPARAVQEQTGVTFAGLVVDEGTNEGIPNAEVSIPNQLSETLTDDTGYFKLTLRAGSSPSQLFNLRVRKAGYETRERTLSPNNDMKMLLRRQ